MCVGIHSVVFDEQCQNIVAMCSLEGETVPLRNPVHISSLVEVKLLCKVLCYISICSKLNVSLKALL